MAPNTRKKKIQIFNSLDLKVALIPSVSPVTGQAVFEIFFHSVIIIFALNLLDLPSL